MTGILKMAALGGAGAYAQTVGGGGSANPLDPETQDSIKKGVLFSGILGGLGNVARIVSSTEKAASGMTPAMENELAQTRPSTVGSYINIAASSAKDFHAPTVDDVVVNDITRGANILTNKVIPQAGKAVGEARVAAGDAPVIYLHPADATVPPTTGAGAVAAVRDDINNFMQETVGHQFGSYASAADSGLPISNYPEGASASGLNGDETTIEKIPGRAVDLSPTETNTLEYVGKQLQTLQENPNVQIASDVLRNLDRKIDWTKPADGPVESLVRYARGAINKTIAPAAPALAKANDAFGQLKDIENATRDAAGKDLNHVDLLARRTVYAGQSGKAQSVLDGLYSAVKPYLPPGEESYASKAIVARFAKANFGGLNSKSGFEQGMSSGDIAGLAGYRSRVIGAALRAGKRVLAPDPAQYAMSVSKGEPYSFVPLAHHIDEYLDSPSAQPWINSFKGSLKAMGISSHNVGQTAKDALRMIMFNNVTQPTEGQRQLIP